MTNTSTNTTISAPAMALGNAINECLLWRDARTTATFKLTPEDFKVNEVLEWQFTGAGEHLFLLIEKSDSNTLWVAKQLAKFYGVPVRDIGYSGLKDRHAVTQQYFSIRLPGVKPDSYTLPTHEAYRVISHGLHDKKLKRGNHRFNDFIIRLRDVDDANALTHGLLQIQQHGCPNFFDTQRFGHHDGNLREALTWLKTGEAPRKRTDKSFQLSALRAAIFNHLLAERVKNGTWNQLIDGDVALLDGSNSHFAVEQVDDTLSARVATGDIHPAGVLVGEDSLLAVSELIGYAELLAAAKVIFEKERLATDYRPLRLAVNNLQWQQLSDSDWQIAMRLPAGAYASGVIRQLIDFKDL